MSTWQIWAEGYAVSGMSSGAQLLAEQEADTFDQAVQQHVNNLPTDQARFFRRSRDGVWQQWGCVLYPTETEARRTFG